MRFRGQLRMFRKRRWPRARWLWLEMDDDPGRWLGGMSGHVRTQCGDSEVRAVVHKSAVLQSKRDVPHKSIIHASSVNECWSGLSLRPGNEPSRVACRIKYERSRSRKHIG